MIKVPKKNGVRSVNRHELRKFETPLYTVATETKNVIVYYAGDTIPSYLTDVVDNKEL